MDDCENMGAGRQLLALGLQTRGRKVLGEDGFLRSSPTIDTGGAQTLPHLTVITLPTVARTGQSNVSVKT